MRLRPPQLQDAAAVIELITARDIADLGLPDFTLEDLLDEWRALGRALRTDAVVAEIGGGRIAGYAAVRSMGSHGIVPPEYEGRGIGTQLLRWAEGRERTRGHERHRQWTAERQAAAHALLQEAGYEHARSYWRMVCDLQPTPPAAPVPTGVVVRPIDAAGDAHTLHELDEVSFQGSPDYVPEPFEGFRAMHLEAHDLQPSASLLAEQGGQPVGFILSRRWAQEAVGYVAVLGVHPDHRRRGIGSALLTLAFAGFAAAGLREAQLGVASDNPRALDLYTRSGMRPRFRFDVYERPVIPAPGSAADGSGARLQA